MCRHGRLFQLAGVRKRRIVILLLFLILLLLILLLLILLFLILLLLILLLFCCCRVGRLLLGSVSIHRSSNSNSSISIGDCLGGRDLVYMWRRVAIPVRHIERIANWLCVMLELVRRRGLYSLSECRLWLVYHGGLIDVVRQRSHLLRRRRRVSDSNQCRLWREHHRRRRCRQWARNERRRAGLHRENESARGAIGAR